MELRDYIRVLLKHWISIVAITLVGLVGAAAFTFTQPRLYTAQAQSFVALTGNDLGGIAGGATFTGQRLASYVQLASTPDVLQPVIDELGLNRQLAFVVNSIWTPQDTRSVSRHSRVDLDPIKTQLLELGGVCLPLFGGDVLIKYPIGMDTTARVHAHRWGQFFQNYKVIKVS